MTALLDLLLQVVASVLLLLGPGAGCDGIQPVSIRHEDGSGVVGAECVPDPRFPDETPYVVFVIDGEDGVYRLDASR